MPPESAKVNILLVDDEPRNLTALEAILAAEDRRLVMAQSGEEALRHLLREDFAVILLDVRMPGLDGFETASFIRSRDKSRHTPIIFITADNTSETHVTRGYSLGAVDYLFKPVEPEILQSKVNVFVDLFQKTRQVTLQAEQLAEATAFLENVLASSVEYAIIAVDLAGQILVWNEGARRTYGVTATEATGRSLAEVVAPDREAELAAVIESLQEGRAVDAFEMIQARADGGMVEVSIVASPIRNAAGRMIGATFIAHDISERRRAEEARAKLLQEQLAREAAEAAQQRFAFLAEAGTLLSATLEYEATLESLARVVVPHLADWCSVDLVQQDDNKLELVAAAHVQPPKTPLIREHRRRFPLITSSDRGPLRVLRTGQSEIHPDIEGLGSDPGFAPEQAHYLEELGTRSLMHVPLVARGRILGVLSFVSAQAGRYGPEDLALAEDLARRAALAVDNARLYRDVQASVKARDEFLSSASHDLKTPLTAIRGLAQLAHRKALRMDGPDGDWLAERLNGIVSATARMTTVINELLDVASLQMGRPLDLDRQPTDLVSLVRQAVGDAQHAADCPPLRVEAPGAEVIGEWDPARLERVIANLLSNAIKYSPNGREIDLIIGRDAPDDGSSWATLSIQDRGIGIPASDLPRIFERFHRAGNVVGRIAGTGIGLAGSRQIVEQHGGTIEVESREGVGSTFTVRLPLSPESVGVHSPKSKV